MTSRKYREKGRLIRQGDEVLFLCPDGTIAKVNDVLLTRIFTGFKDTDKIKGNHGYWNLENKEMDEYPGETLAIIPQTGVTLVIYDSSVFNPIIAMTDSSEYITTTEYAKNNKCSSARVRVLCGQGRIPGAVKKGNRWLIPKFASYPRDARFYNQRKDKHAK